MDNTILNALILTTLAGLSTTVGSLLGLVVRNPGKSFLSFTLGFSAGVMILVSLVELFPGGVETIGWVSAIIGFNIGALLMFLVDWFVPHDYILHHEDNIGPKKARMLKAGLFVALGIGIHNFPEGMATFAGALKDIKVGMAIAVAIAIHNIPEGLAISVPVYAATGSRAKAFWWSFLSGVAEPVGAGIAALFLMPYLNDAVLGWLLTIVAGIMIYISLDELLPVSREGGYEHQSIGGVFIGMAVMAVTLWMLS